MDAYPHAEEVDKELPEYIPSENVLELGNNQNVRVKLTKDNYKERMHYLLYLEEHEHKKIMSRYPLLNSITCICIYLVVKGVGMGEKRAYYVHKSIKPHHGLCASRACRLPPKT